MYICPNCGTQAAKPIKKHQSSLAAEIGLWLLCVIAAGMSGFWLLLVLPLVYSMWRQFAKTGAICPSCKFDGMIQATTPRGQELIK